MFDSITEPVAFIVAYIAFAVALIGSGSLAVSALRWAAATRRRWARIEEPLERRLREAAEALGWAYRPVTPPSFLDKVLAVGRLRYGIAARGSHMMEFTPDNERFVVFDVDPFGCGIEKVVVVWCPPMRLHPGRIDRLSAKLLPAVPVFSSAFRAQPKPDWWVDEDIAVWSFRGRLSLCNLEALMEAACHFADAMTNVIATNPRQTL